MAYSLVCERCKQYVSVWDDNVDIHTFAEYHGPCKAVVLKSEYEFDTSDAPPSFREWNRNDFEELIQLIDYD